MDMHVSTAQPAEDMALPAVLQAAADELMHLAVMADGLGVCQVVSTEQWQSLDRMSQHLGELATFLTAVSSAVPDIRPNLAAAVAAVRVGKLANRLTARPLPEVEEDSGEFEMFDA